MVFVNEDGQRVLDAIIKQTHNLCITKSGVKNQIYKFAKEKGLNCDEIQQKILELIKGRCVAAYSVFNKLADLGIMDKLSEEDLSKMIDCAKMFNAKHNQAQIKLSELCAKYLNLSYKRPYPYAVITFLNS